MLKGATERMEKEKKSRKSIKNTITSWMKNLDNNIYSFRYMWNNSKGTFLISVANALINGLMNPAVLHFEQPTLYIAWRTAVFCGCAVRNS